MLWKHSTFSTLFVISCLAILPVTAQSQKQSDGYVIAVEGDWRLTGKSGITKIIKGTAVSSAETITAISKDKGKIAIALNDGTVLSQVCPSDKCKNGTTIPPVTKTDETSKFLLETLFVDDIHIDIEGPTRGKKLVDCVVRKSKDKVNLAPLLTGYDDGDCELTFVPFASNGKPATTPSLKKSVNVPNPMGADLPIPCADLQYGLYLVNTPETSDALVLVVPEDKYPTLAKQFQSAAALIGRWGKDKQISLKDQRIYKKKALYSLAYPKTAKP